MLREKRLILSLIGMSNMGKTYWSKKLRDAGFRHINCDDLIEERLAAVLKKIGYSGIAGVSRWMGQPYDERFLANQQKYLALEKEVMENIFERLKNGESGNTVIDTTGSVVHIDGNVRARLRQCSFVVYLEATERIKEKMFDRYIKKPKPVVFADVFKAREGESATDALKRCYKELLAVREGLYSECADVTVSYGAVKRGMSGSQFIALVKQLI